jgi:hypothetical protein
VLPGVLQAVASIAAAIDSAEHRYHILGALCAVFLVFFGTAKVRSRSGTLRASVAIGLNGFVGDRVWQVLGRFTKETRTPGQVQQLQQWRVHVRQLLHKDGAPCFVSVSNKLLGAVSLVLMCRAVRAVRRFGAAVVEELLGRCCWQSLRTRQGGFCVFLHVQLNATRFRHCWHVACKALHAHIAMLWAHIKPTRHKSRSNFQSYPVLHRSNPTSYVHVRG